MYERVMGADYARLDKEVQQFHRLQGQVKLQGTVLVDAPQTVWAALLGWCLGAPRTGAQGAIAFELETLPERERWTRHFPGKTMRSEISLCGGGVVEKLGATTLRFHLGEQRGALTMQLVGLRFLGIPCPAWLRPRVLAREHGSEGMMHFWVEASVPGIGLVTRYRGALRIP
ncbi:MAG: DUF4166 domain-containing protein [Burkholderiales bacterium]|nr:DUF4166 domain-containing protein [Burkholderiales bacterium]